MGSDQTAQERNGIGSQFLRGLNTSVSGNAQAFGFSITITTSFGAVSARQGPPETLEMTGFALSAVAAFSLLNLVVSHLVKTDPESSAGKRTMLMATAADFLAVGAAVGTALGLRSVVDGWQSWVLVPFCTSLVYLLVQGVEMAVGREETGGGDGDD